MVVGHEAPRAFRGAFRRDVGHECSGPGPLPQGSRVGSRPSSRACQMSRSLSSSEPGRGARAAVAGASYRLPISGHERTSRTASSPGDDGDDGSDRRRPEPPGEARVARHDRTPRPRRRVPCRAGSRARRRPSRRGRRPPAGRAPRRHVVRRPGSRAARPRPRAARSWPPRRGGTSCPGRGRSARRRRCRRRSTRTRAWRSPPPPAPRNPARAARPGRRSGRTAPGRPPQASPASRTSSSKQVSAPVWQAGPVWSTRSRTVSPSQSSRTSTTRWVCPEVSPLTQ